MASGDINSAPTSGLPASTENGVPAGYPKLAELMSIAPSASIFRRFGFLNIMHLLRLQAELHDMEEKLKDVWKEDGGSGDPVRMAYAGDFRLIRDFIEDGDSTQYELLVEIGEKLKQYNESLRLFAAVAGVGRPAASDVEFLRRWLQRPSIGNNFLTGLESSIWAPENDKDLLCLMAQREESDWFSDFLREKMLSLYHYVFGRRTQSSSKILHENARHYHEQGIETTSRAITAGLSASLTTPMVLVLYYIRNMEVRIGLVIVFTTIFSVTLALFTGAKKAEILAATAAFAAVEVVFIGSVSGPE